VTKNLLLLVILFLEWMFIFPTLSLASDYNFQDEFNLERPSNVLDTIKWNIYPNSTSETRIKESGGSVQLLSGISNIFPYVVSKINPFPTTGDFTLEFGIQFTSVVQRGNGLVISLIPPANNINEVAKDRPEIYFFGVWQDADKGFNVTYNGFCAFGLTCSQPGVNIYNTPSPNLSYHKVKLIYSNSVYQAYVDGNRMFISPPTTNRPQAIWFGNPANQYANASWSSFRVDYIRISGLPTPFLDLPWDYQSKGLSFNEAALAINSFFDHQYPLLSRGADLSEPDSAIPTIVNYLGQTTNDNYTKHDGYDWGSRARANLGDSVLAAASGSATFINSCASCGNMIVIDHGNGYQTRYLHLLEDGLITNIPNQPIPVNNRQQIGRVGFSGDVKPEGKPGAHIHFGVFQDKNNDGSFTDNEPDGVTDPYGWQSKSADPWEGYTFNYQGENRIGNKSYYLWKNKLADSTSNIASAGATINTANFTLNFPQNFTNQNIVVNAKSAPIVQTLNNLISLGSTLLINAANSAGAPVTTAVNPYTILFDFSNLDQSKIKPNSLFLYSSPDGLNWTKETTIFPSPTQAQIQINHFSYFALLGERLDSAPPTTTAGLSGTEGQPGWFRSDVNLTLIATDNEGGLGVDYTLYKINDGNIQLYTGPVSFTNEGHYKVEFYSTDKDGNTEEIKSVEFNIDKTPPEARISLENLQALLSVTGLDTNQTSVTKLGTNKKPIYRISDQAGNTLNLEIHNISPKDSLIGIYSLKYNDSPPVMQSRTRFRVQFKKNSATPIRLLQEFVANNQVKIQIHYNELHNRSAIYVFENNLKKLKETRSGQVVLSVSTDQGSLKYSY